MTGVLLDSFLFSYLEFAFLWYRLRLVMNTVNCPEVVVGGYVVPKQLLQQEHYLTVSI